MRPEDKDSLSKEKGPYYHGARAAHYERLKHLKQPHVHVHPDTGEYVTPFHPGAVKKTDLTPEEREAFHRGYNDQKNYPMHVLGEKDFD